jgi:hypothetical protein
MIDNIPPDCLAYIELAARELISEQGLVFDSPEEFSRWTFQNISGIANRAKALQEQLVFVKVLGQPETLETLSKTMAGVVWQRINATRSQELPEAPIASAGAKLGRLYLQDNQLAELPVEGLRNLLRNPGDVSGNDATQDE